LKLREGLNELAPKGKMTKTLSSEVFALLSNVFRHVVPERKTFKIVKNEDLQLIE
jgi:hypothetical protein